MKLILKICGRVGHNDFISNHCYLCLHKKGEKTFSWLIISINRSHFPDLRIQKNVTRRVFDPITLKEYLEIMDGTYLNNSGGIISLSEP